MDVKLVGGDGNAFTVMGKVIAGLRSAKAPEEDIDLYKKEAMSGDYNNLLCVSMDWVNVV